MADNIADNKLDWFRNAKYGLFIHWGLYTIPGGEWNGQLAPHGTEWIMKTMRIPLKDYRELLSRFDPDAFDPYYYVRRAKEWGMKYIVLTAKHHDGFALFDTKVSDYSVMHTPYGRDIVRQFSDACASEGLTFCVYYSQMQDWEDPDGNGNTWDYDPACQDFSRYFYGKVIPQVRELLTNYGKLGMIWFDTPYDMPVALCRELAGTVHACQPDCLINGRIGYGIGDFREAADNAIPLLSRSDPWESPMTLNHTWGYSRRDNDFKSPRQVLENLVRVVGKGGNLLLNVGPDEHGMIPAKSEEVLCAAGEWLRVNGESIYGTSGVPDFPYLIPWGGLTYSSCRRTLYLHVMHYPSYPYRLLLTGLETPVTGIRLLRSGAPLQFMQSYEPARDEHRLYISLPEVCPDTDDTVLAVSLSGPVSVQKI
ncbi:MAG: alpha-L-fucosidase [Clostridia bacterium]|nr:alpha-L-fucosidase [Clostridia bacterium]